MARRLDEAQLLLIAAAVMASPPEEVLAATDVAALSRVSASIEACADPLDVAAAALVGIAAERPFGHDSKAVAWLACAVAAPAEAARLAADRSDAIELVRRAAHGEATRDLVRQQLANHRPTCPVCRRTLRPGPRPGIGSTRSTSIELVARCAVEHRAHGRFGQAPVEPSRVADTPWRPVLSHGATGAMIVLADDAPLLLVPADEDYLVAHPTFVAGDLVGEWRSIIADAPVRTSVPGEAIVLSSDGSMIDWSRLRRVVEAAPLRV